MKKTQLMGILNCTPDSFFEESRALTTEEAIQKGLRLLDEGADILDIGGESTRPSAHASVPEEEELCRVIPVIEGLRKKTSKPLSIDTYRPKVAQAAIEAGVTFLNDITGFSNPAMRCLAKTSGLPICVMHMASPPHQDIKPVYANGIIAELLLFFEKRIDLLLSEGINPSQIYIDPGIGGGSFGKNMEENCSILRNIKKLKSLGFPILLGISRKSFLQKILHKPASEILSTTLAINTMSILEGVEMIRVHDVSAHRDILTVLEILFHAP